jgi:hypothetical protein
MSLGHGNNVWHMLLKMDKTCSKWIKRRNDFDIDIISAQLLSIDYSQSPFIIFHTSKYQQSHTNTKADTKYRRKRKTAQKTLYETVNPLRYQQQGKQKETIK